MLPKTIGIVRVSRWRAAVGGVEYEEYGRTIRELNIKVE
jgi:hypothetical protein